MSEQVKHKVAIVDYGLGNLFSVKNACEKVGLKGQVTNQRNQIMNSDAVILPGVGAFGDAMHSLRQWGLIEVLIELATSYKPLIGICLGMQLLMEESFEFGHQEGLGIIKGSVKPFQNYSEKKKKKIKVPQVGWNKIYRPKNNSHNNMWVDTFLEGLMDGEFFYFVHSFYIKPNEENLVLSSTEYGDLCFCSCLKRRNIFACQFHPERSGVQGLRIYENLATYLNHKIEI